MATPASRRPPSGSSSRSWLSIAKLRSSRRCHSTLGGISPANYKTSHQPGGAQAVSLSICSTIRVNHSNNPTRHGLGPADAGYAAVRSFLRSWVVVPPQTPVSSLSARAKSRQSCRTGQVEQMTRAFVEEAPTDGKNRSRSSPRHCARSIHPGRLFDSLVVASSSVTGMSVRRIRGPFGTSGRVETSGLLAPYDGESALVAVWPRRSSAAARVRTTFPRALSPSMRLM